MLIAAGCERNAEGNSPRDDYMEPKVTNSLEHPPSYQSVDTNCKDNLWSSWVILVELNRTGKRMTASVIAALSYGILTILGGIVGYVKSRSKVSLISGSCLGALVVGGALSFWQGQSWGLNLATAVTALLVLVFAVRWWKTGKIMPAGLMVCLGAIAFAAIII